MGALLEIVRSRIAQAGNHPAWLLALVWILIFLIAALIALLFIHGRGQKIRTPLKPTIDPGLDPVEPRRQAMRARHEVRPLTPLEDGFGLSKLPDGAFGFTALPATRDSPVLRSMQLGLFEIHRKPDGSIRIVGFTSAATADSLGAAHIRARLYREPATGAPVLVSVAMSSIMRHIARDQDWVEIDLEPEVTQNAPAAKPPATAKASAANARSA